ncbi:ABC transporter permease [Marinobacterium mangrovicola]|uniref:Iron(III) transport system permease protein n=1 Tax=Marinobacterium mangrovicola TaxID=1476959 RepID=A0A4R1GIG8_9GAMM|nr:iron ABC transporter permease [Marinobacterium mangrovicola]TCK05679.1 iron(III) transport system permease protein [Marinobacterium mangrovicola]
MLRALSGDQPRWLVALILSLILLLSLTPSLRLMVEALSQLELGSESPLARVLRDGATWQAAYHSLYTSGLATLIALVLGALFACALSLTNVSGRQWLVFCFMLPMMIPPQVTALSWLQLFGPSSPLLNSLGIAPALGSSQPLYSAEGIALLMGIQHAPLVFLTLRSSLINMPAELIEAARINGASQRRVWLDVIFPLCRSGLVAAAAIAFVSALGNFGIPAMLGIPASYYVLPTLIYQHMAGFGQSMLSDVAVLSMLIGVLALIGVLVQQRFVRRAQYELLGHTGRAQAFVLDSRHRLLLQLLLWTVLALILVAPLIALIISSLVPALGVALDSDTFTLSAYVEMLTRQGSTARAFGNSLLLASGAALFLMCLSLPLGWMMSRMSVRARTSLNSLIEIPYALPGVVLAIACILLFAQPLPVIEVSLYGSLAIIFIAYLARFMSIALKPVQASAGQLDGSLEEAAQLAGAGPLRRLVQIVLPLVAPALFAGGLLVFLTAVNELTVSALLWSAGNETLGVLVFNLDEGGDSVLAAAISVVIVLMVVALMLLLSLMGRWLPQGVIPWRT